VGAYLRMNAYRQCVSNRNFPSPTKAGEREGKGDKRFSFPFLDEQNQTVPSR
jgi:hypothetical protein